MSDRIIIDSHILVWLIFEPENLSKSTIEDLKQASELYVSIVSIWELALKYKKGKFAYNPADIISGYKKTGIELLDLKEEHIKEIGNIKLSHKDPFDELLIAQAKSESMPLLTADSQLIDSMYQTIDAR